MHPTKSNPDTRPRFMSEADCRDLIQRLARFSTGGGYTTATIMSSWTGNVRWGRNQISTSGEVQNNYVILNRNLNGATARLLINDTSDTALIAAARRAERIARVRQERPFSDLVTRQPLESLPTPKLFSEATYQLDTGQRSEAARQLMQSTVAAGMLSAGYVEVSAHCRAVIDTLGRSVYFPYTQAQYSVTVRDPKGTGSGWAGKDHYDWSQIDGLRLSEIALEKCLKSRAPKAIEPGRYTTILEPQAVCDFVGQLVNRIWGVSDVDRMSAEYEMNYESVFRKTPSNPQEHIPAYSQLGAQVIDKRITIGADPTDPEMGFLPFDSWGLDGWGINYLQVVHPVTWIDKGVLTNLAYETWYPRSHLGRTQSLPNVGALRMSVDGPTSTLEEMIRTTARGLLVTRFDHIERAFPGGYRGNTRDGLWLIEKGQISKPVKNLEFTESVLAALNRVEAFGVPQRVFNPTRIFLETPHPAVVPALKIRDFTFTALDDAV